MNAHEHGDAARRSFHHLGTGESDGLEPVLPLDLAKVRLSIRIQLAIRIAKLDRERIFVDSFAADFARNFSSCAFLAFAAAVSRSPNPFSADRFISFRFV